MNNGRVLLFLCIVLFSLPITSQFNARAISATIRVPKDCPTIQAAIDHANAGDVIMVSSGTYCENLFINKTLTLIGQDKINTTIIGNGSRESVIQANFTTVSISGFAIITNGTNGIMLETCKESTIRDNNVNARTRGIWLYHSNNNTVTANILTESGWVGIVLCGRSSENIVLHNTIGNKTIGIELTGWKNLIYHNNFMNNQNQTSMIESFNNTWSNSLEGNYWSNYKGKDENQDGKGDNPYKIDVNNQDNYPLMGMFSQFQVFKDGADYCVTTISNSTITQVDCENSISLKVSGPDDSTCFCRATISRTLINGNQTILVNGSPPTTRKELPASNTTHACLYFTYTHTTPLVVITPEVLVLIIGLILLLSAIAAVIVARKFRSKKKKFSESENQFEH